MNIDRLFFCNAARKHISLEHLIYRHGACELQHVGKLHLAQPIVVEFYCGSIASGESNKFTCLALIQLQVGFYFTLGERFSCREFVRVANARSKISDQKNNLVPQILKMAQLAQADRVANMKCWRSRIKPCIHCELLVL